MNALKALWAFLTRRKTMTGEVGVTDPGATPTVVEAPAATSYVDIDVLKKLLIALGHDVEKAWDHVVAAATKDA